MTTRQFYGLTSIMMLNTSVLFYIAKVEPLMWGFGVMSVMMILPVLAYGASRLALAVSGWLQQHKRRPPEHHWNDGDSDGEVG